MTRILFVDDEPRVLNGLRRTLRPLARQWEMMFVDSGEKAKRLLERGGYDIVVSDMRMPGVDGAELLAYLRKEFPDVVRIVLSGQAEDAAAQRAVGVAQQFLAKPCTVEGLVEAVSRITGLRERLRTGELRRVIGEIGALPMVPAHYQRLQGLLASPNAPFEEIAALVSSSPGMAAKVLQLVNSSFFGVRVKVDDLANAVRYLGLDVIRDLVLGEEMRRAFEGPIAKGFDLERERRQALLVSNAARALLTDEPLARLAGCAGMVHDVGRLVLASRRPESYDGILDQAAGRAEVETNLEEATWGATHAEIGGYLLGMWGLPDAVVEAVTFHHHPSASFSRRFDVLGAVHVAAALVADESGASLDVEFLKRVGAIDRLDQMRTTVEDVKGRVEGQERAA